MTVSSCLEIPLITASSDHAHHRKRRSEGCVHKIAYQERVRGVQGGHTRSVLVYVLLPLLCVETQRNEKEGWRKDRFPSPGYDGGLPAHTPRADQMYLDDLPVWGMVGESYREENGDEKVFIYTHQKFSLSWNGDRVHFILCCTQSNVTLI